MTRGYDRIVADAFGGPEVLRLRHIERLPEPGEGEVRLRVEAAGVGYTDTIVRRGRYVAYTGGLPLTPGYDVVGIVDAIGPGVRDIRVGDRVADMPVTGAYGQYLVRSAASLVPVPAGVEPSAAVEVPLMWVTAWQMLTRCASLPPGAQILVVGASGAVGRALVALGRHLQLMVIGTCSPGNVALVEDLGAQALEHARPDLVQAVRTASGGGVVAAFDAIGGESWETSWGTLAEGGTLIGYGFQDFLESGAPGAEAAKAMRRFSVELNEIGRADGSRRSTCFYDIQARRGMHPGDYRADADHLLGLIARGEVAPSQAELLPLDQAAAAHRRVAERGLRTRLVLTP